MYPSYLNILGNVCSSAGDNGKRQTYTHILHTGPQNFDPTSLFLLNLKLGLSFFFPRFTGLNSIEIKHQIISSRQTFDDDGYFLSFTW